MARICLSCYNIEVEDIVEEEGGSGDDEEEDCDAETYDLSQYTHLEGTTHYDNIDRAVFKVVHVKAEDFDDGNGVVVVVYRSKFNEKTKSWGKVDMNDPIMVADILKYHNSASNREVMVQKLGTALDSSNSRQAKTKSNQPKK